MVSTKNLGIWMDHSTANLMEFSKEPIITKVIVSEFTHEKKVQSLNKSENVMHHQEKHLVSSFYRKIINEIKNYNHVLLFGPTEAKNELFNLTKTDQHCAHIKIEVKNAERMTQNQEHAFVREYFNPENN